MRQESDQIRVGLERLEIPHRRCGSGTIRCGLLRETIPLRARQPWRYRET